MARKNRNLNTVAEPNLTPMIDCTFQLIIFFIITSQMTNQQLEQMLVPKPEKSRATEPQTTDEGRPDVVVANIFSEFGNREEMKNGKTRDNEPLHAMVAKGYAIKGQQIEIGNTELLVELLTKAKAEFDARKLQNRIFYLEVRADKDIGYQNVLPVMRAAAQSGIAKMYMTAVPDPQYRPN